MAGPPVSVPGYTPAVREADLERVLDPGYLGDLRARELSEVRAMRTECQRLETSLSYVRRLAQGRLDIVAAEQARRRSGEDPVPLEEIVERLPGILADRVHAPGFGRLPPLLAPEDTHDEYVDRLEAICDAEKLGALGGLTDADLEALAGALMSFEQEVSRQRRALHTVIDTLQAEIARRYREGEASVDELLGGR